MQVGKWIIAIILIVLIVIIFTPVFWAIEIADLIKRVREKIKENAQV